ncbi:hypothetical protein scyTo_0007305 [Scyliorhinus torazame]|uniref:Uncharacterized protein n=1 Tax=Scyliorhinus torazame TaxID=75743 RepID=A0A401NPW3_SCYTO|nr:hypothetical protein [Scyliorhinus torazame]
MKTAPYSTGGSPVSIDNPDGISIRHQGHCNQPMGQSHSLENGKGNRVRPYCSETDLPDLHRNKSKGETRKREKLTEETSWRKRKRANPGQLEEGSSAKVRKISDREKEKTNSEKDIKDVSTEDERGSGDKKDKSLSKSKRKRGKNTMIGTRWKKGSFLCEYYPSEILLI